MSLYKSAQNMNRCCFRNELHGLIRFSRKEKQKPMLNKIMLIGNLGRDPELNVTAEGTPVTKFSLAVSRRYKASSGEAKEETEWFNVVAWRNLAEICERYIHKGS